MSTWNFIKFITKLNVFLVCIVILLSLIYGCSVKADESKFKVMIIDTGIYPHEDLKQFLPNDLSGDYVDNVGHGTHIAGIVAYGNASVKGKGFRKNDAICSQVEIISCKYFDPEMPGNDNNSLKNTIKCIKQAIEQHVDVINYSGGGELFSYEEFNAYKEFEKSGGIVVVAAGNEHSKLRENNYFPACYSNKCHEYFILDKSGQLVSPEVAPSLKKKVTYHLGLRNFYYVSNIDKKGKLVISSNDDKYAKKEVGVDVLSTLPNQQYGTLTGTSQSTAAFTHRLLKRFCKYINQGETK